MSKRIRQKDLVAKECPSDVRNQTTIFLPYIFLPFIGVRHSAATK